MPDKCPKKTLNKNWDNSKAALTAHYQDYHQADALSYVTALVMYERVTGVRLNPNTWGWCSDRPTIGAASGLALCVGSFNAKGLDLYYDDPDIVNTGIGCAAFWNL